MNEELIKHQIGIHDKRLNDHSKRIDTLEQNQAKFEIQIQNLILSLNSLTSVLKWFIGLGTSGLVGFFFYGIQKNIF